MSTEYIINMFTVTRVVLLAFMVNIFHFSVKGMSRCVPIRSFRERIEIRKFVFEDFLILYIALITYISLYDGSVGQTENRF